VVSPDLQGKITNLTTQQAKDIFDGTDTNWSQIPGGPSEPINVVVRTKTSGTRATFKRYVMGDPKTTNDEPAGAQEADKTGELVAKVAGTHGAIGYASTSFVLNSDQASKIFPICVDGFGATKANINNGSYKFWSYEHAYTKGEPAASSATGAFLAFVNSSDFQNKDLPKLGFLTTSQLTDAAKATHPTPTFGK
jgi:phosphate transport system substrate-binding protein